MKRNQKNYRMKGIGVLFFTLIIVTCFFMLACENLFIMAILPDNDKTSGDWWEYTVTFDKNYGETDTVYSTKQVKYPDTTVDALPDNPEWSNYSFKHWNTSPAGDGDVFNTATVVNNDITVYAQWQYVESTLGGNAEITGVYRIEQKLTVNTINITGAEAPFKYQWKANSVSISDAIHHEYTLTGADAGKQISCVITHDNAAGSITATGETVPYEIEIGNVIGKEGADAVNINPPYGLVGSNILIYYNLDSTKINNRLEISGVHQNITPIEITGPGSITYTLSATDAVNGIITINAIFTHSNKTLDSISFVDNDSVEKIYGDSAFIKAITNTGAGSGAITYSSSVPTVATVTSDGTVTILKAGITTITATKAEDEYYSNAAANYTLTVSRKPVTITGLNAANKTYDGNTSATPTGTASVNGKVGADDVTVISGTASFNDRNAGINKTVEFHGFSLGGNDSGNYILSVQPASVTANITGLQLTITGDEVVTTKKYDGTAVAHVEHHGTLHGVISGDYVTVSVHAMYNSADVLTANKIDISFVLGGTHASNYIEPVSREITSGVYITKADGAEVSVPTLSTKSSSSIIVSPVTITQPAYGQIAEYAIAKASSPVPSTGWQESNDFAGLDAGTTYYVFARSRETVNVNTGTAKVSAAIATNASAGAPVLFTKIDFQNDNTGSTTKYVSTKGNGTATLSIVADSTPAGNRALQLVTSNYNQAVIIPINLPYELHEYAKISLRIHPISGTTSLNGKSIHIYAASSPNDFLDYGFGNASDSQYNQYANRLIGQSHTLNFGQAPYINAWTDFDLNNIAAAGTTIVGNLKGNAYIAVGLNIDNTAGTYLIDDIDFILRDGFEPPPPPPSFPIPPTTGAVASGNYRNVFLERGLWTQTQIDAKVQTSWDRLFDPNASENYRIYYEVSTDNGPGAYILDSGNNDVRSEGMSYGMMMAVQMNDKNMFDRLWTWAKTYMYRTTNTSNNNRGYFNWSQKTDGSNSQTGIAPDGEFYFATALLFAHARWGSDTGTGTMVPGSGSGATNTADIKNYRWHAMLLLYDMCHREMGTKDPWDAPALFRRPGDHRSENTAANPMSIGNYMPVFSPIGASAKHTDPSYHLPSFNEVWAYELKKDANAGVLHGIWTSAADMLADAAFYETCAQTSRNFFTTAMHSTTGLSPDYSHFNGQPHDDQKYFGYDAFRTVMNVAMDYAWWAKDSRQTGLANRLLNFFHSQGVNTYRGIWDVAGTPWPSSPGPGDHSPGLVAMNATAGLVSTNQNTWDFIEDFWNISMTPGQYRYYDGCLYMFGMLHLSGNYKVYLSGGTYVSDSSIAPSTATFDKRPSQQKNITVEMTLHGNEFVSIQNGQTTLTQGAHYTRSGDTITLLSSYLSALSNGMTTLTFNFSAGRSRSLDIEVITTNASNSMISPITAVFAKTLPANIPVTMTLNGNTFNRIQNGGTTLTQGSNYTVSGSNVTINQSYLSGFSDSTQTLTFYFSEGNNAVLTVTIQDYMPSEINPAAATFYKDIKNDIEAAMTLNGNTFTEVRNNTTPLTLDTHYTRNGNTVTILGTYLDSLSGSQATLTFVFNQGGNKQLVISIKEVNPDRMVVIDFESTIGQIVSTRGGSSSISATIAVTTDPANPAEKSLRVTTATSGTNEWNRAPIIPVNLPQSLSSYKSLSFRFYLQSGTSDNPSQNRPIAVYLHDTNTVGNNNHFPDYQFGNNDNAWYSARLLGQTTPVNFSATGWINYEIPINSLPAAIANLQGNNFIAIGINNGTPLDYYIDDIIFVLKDDFVVPAAISPTSAVFFKAAAEQEDIPVTMTLNGLSLTSIQNGGATLVNGTNYTVNGNVVTIQKSYLAGLDLGKTTLTFNFNKGPSSNLEIAVENDKASAMKLSYDFTSAAAINTDFVTFGGTGDMSAAWNAAEGGVLQVSKTNNNHSTSTFILPFSLGSTNLGDYSQIIVNIKGISGDFGSKTFRARSGSTVLGTASTGGNLNNFYNLVITLPTSGLGSLNGNIQISFEFDNTQAYVVQIKSIQLVPR